MPDLVATLTEERQQVADALTAMVEADDFDPDSKEFAELKTRGERTDKRLAAIREAQQHRAAADQLLGARGRPAGQQAPGQSLGDVFLRSEAFRDWRKRGGRGREFIGEFQTRALLDTSWFPGVDSRIVADPPAPRSPLVDVLGSTTVSSGSVEVVTYNPQPPIAAVVPEGTQKPEATITTGITTVTLDTIAHWIEVTRQALDDESMVRDLISGGLMRGVTKKVEDAAAQVLNGGAFGVMQGADLLEAIRLSVAYLQDAGFDPNAILINPLDAGALDSAIWGMTNTGPVINSSLFGMRIVIASAITQGSPLVGDWPAAAKHLTRGAVELYVSDSDVGIVATNPVSNFKRNVITFLAEQRAKTAITQTGAAFKCTVTGP